MHDCISCFSQLLALFADPRIGGILQKAERFFPFAKKLSFTEILRAHFAAQLLQVKSLRHTALLLASSPQAQKEILPDCQPPTPKEQDLKARRQAVARLKSLPSSERWQPLVEATQAFSAQKEQKPSRRSLWRPISLSQLSRSNRLVDTEIWRELIEAVRSVVAATPGHNRITGDRSC